ncbi:MAG: ERAP1-like C-terminal domain-containing protein [Planctomycetes bacterium]|nr:ERAP1-like C-terminal domain-containing protein [Planctomycetota bacterium]
MTFQHLVLLLVSSFLLAACALGPRPDEGDDWDEPRLAEGISRRLAFERGELIGDLDYRLWLRLGTGDGFQGECRIGLDLAEVPDELVLDFRGRSIDQVLVNGQEVAGRRETNHLILPGAPFVAGANTIQIGYQGEIGAAGKGIIRVDDRDDGSVYLYTLNVPADGHALFPCFDQPDLKGRFTLEVEAPSDWRVIANAPQLGAPEPLGQGLARFRFAETRPISTYLFAFAAGPFIERQQVVAGREIRCYARRSQPALLDRHLAELMRLHGAALGFLEDWFAIPYPFQKFAFVIVPDFPFSGMEHPGCIFYGEDPTLFRSEVTRLREAGRADLIAHETAHMWFGDLVTMPWFDDVWLKEGFATFMAHKVLERTFGGVDHDLAFFLRNNVAAIDTDATPGTTPMRQPLRNMMDAKSNYGPIIYRKGPAVLRALEYAMGEEAFQRGSRLFLDRHAYDCGSWFDLKAALEEAGEGEGSLDDYGAAWIEGAGIPEVWSRIEDAGGSLPRIVIEQVSASGNDWTWPLALECCWHDRAGKLASQRLTFATPEAEIVGGQVDGRGFSFANQGNRAYGRFRLSAEARDHVLADFEHLDDPLLRAMLWEALWYEVEDAELAPIDYLVFARKQFWRETDQRLVATILGRVATVLARHLSDTQRAQMAVFWESDVAEAIFDETIDRGLRLLLFRAYPSIVQTRGGAILLRNLVEKKASPPGIEVSTRDRWSALTRLMILGDPRAEELFTLMKTEDAGDEGRRRAFLVDCARPDLATKRALFRRFFTDPELPERWVQDGVSVFFASEQAALTDEFVAESLERLDWIKANRKIFFLSAWLEGVIRSRLSPAAAELAWAHAERPSTQEDVRKKLLVPLAHLDRTLRIRERYARD